MSTVDAIQEEVKNYLDNAIQAEELKSKTSVNDTWKNALLKKLEEVYKLQQSVLIAKVGQAFQKEAKSMMKNVHTFFLSKKGFSAYETNELVASIRKLHQQIEDLHLEPIERLRELYITQFLKIKKP